MSSTDMTMSNKEEAVLQRKTVHKCFQLSSTQVSLARIGSQAYALPNKGYWVDNNSDWHRNTKGTNNKENGNDTPQ